MKEQMDHRRSAEGFKNLLTTTGWLMTLDGLKSTARLV